MSNASCIRWHFLLGESVEYLLVSGSGLNEHSKAIVKACNGARRLTPVDGPLSFQVADGVLVAGAKPLVSNDHTIYWDGHGVAGDKAFSSGTKYAPVPSIWVSHKNACIRGIEAGDLRGVFSSILLNQRTGEFALVLDPLSQYSVFVWRQAGVLVASNSIYLLEAAVNSFGVQLTRSVVAACFEIGCTIGAGTRTGFEDVEVLPYGMCITGRNENWHLKPSKYCAGTKGLGYSELLQKTVERLTGYMSALASTFGSSNLLFDLTGGQDSRMCFAAAIGAGIEPINMFVGGNEGDDDKYVARQLAQLYGAKEGNFPENYTETSVRAHELAQRATFHQQGYSTLYHYALGQGRLNTVARVRGGAGELARSHLEPVSNGNLFSDIPKKAFRLLRRREPVYLEVLKGFWLRGLNEKHNAAYRWAFFFGRNLQGKKTLFSDDFKRLALRSLHQDLYDQAESVGSMGMDLYFKDRTRRHFAYLTRALNFSSGAFEPLYDPFLVAAAEALDWHERSSGKLAFDLMEKMAGKQILKVPFASKSLQSKPREYLSKRLGVAPESLSAVDRSYMPQIQSSKIHAGQGIDQWAEFDGPEAMGMHGRYIWQNRYYLQALAGGLSNSNNCWRWIDRDKFLSATASDTFFYRSEKEMTHGLRFLHAFIWLAKEEGETGITSLI